MHAGRRLTLSYIRALQLAIDAYTSIVSIYLYTYKTLITLFVWLFICLFETVRTNPGYGMAALIYNNLLNLISCTVILLRSS